MSQVHISHQSWVHFQQETPSRCDVMYLVVSVNNYLLSVISKCVLFEPRDKLIFITKKLSIFRKSKSCKICGMYPRIGRKQKIYIFQIVSVRDLVQHIQQWRTKSSRSFLCNDLYKKRAGSQLYCHPQELFAIMFNDHKDNGVSR